MSALEAQYQALARYNRFMNERLYELAATLSDEERRRDMGAFFGSIAGTLNHLLLADRVWLQRFTGDTERFVSRDAAGRVIQVQSLRQELYGDFEALRRERTATDGDIEAFVADLTPERLEGNLRYRGLVRPEPFEHPLWWAVGHFFNHQTHHRGQVTTLLMQLGRDPGVTDLIWLLRGDA
jgi:uncharacterized damage-inducible protein DinB